MGRALPIGTGCSFESHAMRSWFKSAARNSPQEIQARVLRFLGEQDGQPERELKDQLISLFCLDQEIENAYLARVAYDDSSAVSVALCLRSRSGPSRETAEKIGRIFASMFGSHEHLD